ncbi:MAG: hypothetical protein M5E90_02150 [Asgard group archaeon]|nr:hypothetical protein [Asgard group archaeon]
MHRSTFTVSKINYWWLYSITELGNNQDDDEKEEGTVEADSDPIQQTNKQINKNLMHSLYFISNYPLLL